MRRRYLKGTGQAVQHEPFHDQQTADQTQHRPRRRAQQAEIDRHAHSDEEQAEQQAFEGLDIGLDFMTVFESANNTPARKAPKAIDRPAMSISKVATMTSIRLVAAKMSWLPEAATQRKTGRSR